MIVVGVDPGLHEVGVAVMCSERGLIHRDLVRVGAAQRTALAYKVAANQVSNTICKHLDGPAAVFVEEMRVRHHDHSINDDDLLALAYLSGAVLGSLTLRYTLRLVTVHEWKGQLPKHVVQNRIERAIGPLNLEEEFGAKAHNIYDAIGIARYGLSFY